MLEQILRHFPAHTHPLTLVSDPDGLLAEEELLAELYARGFTVLAEGDPLRLRQRVEGARPWSAAKPLIIVTGGAVDELPYDLWQGGQRLNLALHTFFPHLAYPLLAELSPAQRARLGAIPQPASVLGREGSARYLLRQLFGADPERLQEPAQFIAWLNRTHESGERLPPTLAAHLLARLGAVPAYRDWPLERLLADGRAFAEFVRREFGAALGKLLGGGEAPRYLTGITGDESLQGLLPALLRSGALEPVPLPGGRPVPAWARSLVLAEGEDMRVRRMAELAALFAECRWELLPQSHWEEWQPLCWAWAEWTALRDEPGTAVEGGVRNRYVECARRLDEAFLAWLKRSYAPLAVQRLPTPHHLHHVPDYLAYERRQGRAERVALLVLDGMALGDWAPIRATWQARHAAWVLDERLLLAQIPTLTAISRRALLGGRRPADVASMLEDAQAEGKLWRAFWVGQELWPGACQTIHLALDREEMPDLPSGAATQALAVIDHSLDEITHGASLGATGRQANLQVWLEEYSPRLERLMAELLRDGYTLYVTSDHGHVEARGMGQPSSGVLAETRSQRARIYRDRALALNARAQFPTTLIWEEDGLLPAGWCALLPSGRQAFAPTGDIVVTHGGASVDEVVVPLVTIRL